MMAVFATCLIAILGLWTILSIAFALPLPAIRRRIERHNAALWVARWTMFGASKGRFATIARYTFEYRDHEPRGRTGEWVTVMDGRPWCWHAALWQPRRRIADRLHRIAQDIDYERRRSPGVHAVATAYRPSLENFLQSVAPRVHIPRDVRIVAVRSSADTAPGSRRAVEVTVERQIILEFTVSDGTC